MRRHVWLKTAVLVLREDLTALQRIINWEEEQFDCLLEVLQQFSRYDTLDSVEAAVKHSAKVMRGELLPLPKVLFKKISTIDPDIFQQHCHEVKDKTDTLSGFIDRIRLSMARFETWKVIQEVTKSDMEELVKRFPGKLEDDVIDKFEGVEIKKNKRLKEELESYVNSLLTKSSGVLVEAESIESFKSNQLAQFDLRVFLANSYSQEDPTSLVQNIQDIKEMRVGTNIFLSHNVEDESILNSVASEIQVENCRSLYFKTEPDSKSEEIVENLLVAVLMSDKPLPKDLKRFQGNLESELEELVLKICHPEDKVLFVLPDAKQIVRIDKSGTVSVKYVVKRSAVKRLSKLISQKESKEDVTNMDKEVGEDMEKEKDESAEIVKLKTVIEKKDTLIRAYVRRLEKLACGKIMTERGTQHPKPEKVTSSHSEEDSQEDSEEDAEESCKKYNSQEDSEQDSEEDGDKSGEEENNNTSENMENSGSVSLLQ